ncbi:MAG: glycosyltransferase family 2 protein, partial [Candidatus Aminicenantes bacterium]|nr:glycosyltransferase family 2 protein [Candidatus Aminicenantes bacterium]
MSAGGSPRVSAILVNYNDGPHLEACLEAVRASAPSGAEIILVDNASTDGSADRAAGRFPEVRLLRNPANVGFARANNRAVGESRGEFLLFLNTDAVLAPGAVEALLEEADKDARVGAAGPALVHSPGRYQVSFGRRVNFPSQFLQKMVVNPYRKAQLRFARKPRRVGWLSAACLLCRREAFTGAGGFDERFFIYFEDIDLCLRMRKAGWKLLYVPAAAVVHKGGATTAPRRRSSRLEYRRSQVAFYEKHNSRASLVLLRAYVRAVLAFGRLTGSFRGPEGSGLWRDYRALLKRGR